MNKHAKVLLVSAALLIASQANGTGRATCDAGPKEGWQSIEALTKQLEAKGWKVRRVKVDGGCYEVYGLNEKGQKVEEYFHPKTLEPVPTKPR